MAKKDKIRILFVGDGVVPTGFSRVVHSIIEKLPEKDYDIHHFAINYFGDPHDYRHKIYPAFSPSHPGEMYGYNKLPAVLSVIQFDIICIVNDPWIINNYLQVIKKGSYKKLPKIVAYFPVDGKFLDKKWFSEWDIVTKAVTYTEFAKQEVVKAEPDIAPIIIPHGVNNRVFKKTFSTRKEAKKVIFPSSERLWDSFIILNAGRNQPRKRIDVALEAFFLFAMDKPANVMYYHHAGIEDSGWNVVKLAKRMGIDDRIILTSNSNTVQTIPDDKLNILYNACDVGLNTGLGEGLAN